MSALAGLDSKRHEGEAQVTLVAFAVWAVPLHRVALRRETRLARIRARVFGQ